MRCPKQEQTMESSILDIRVLRFGMLSVITLSSYHLNNLRKSSNQVLWQAINCIYNTIQLPSSVVNLSAYFIFLLISAKCHLI